MFAKPNPKQSFPRLEEKIIQYWRKHKTFEKSVQHNKGKKEYVFYDGPPFATGLPHYGHILAGTLKDVIPRYQTMRGYHVPRRWGWDCHGLPVENLVEKELGLENKQDLLKFGIDKFNEACRASVLRYAGEWGKVVERMGRWVDFEDSYKTMDSSFMESVWWVFKSLWDKGLIYEGKKAMHVCPRCVTPLSNFEVGLGYKDVTDFSTTAQFKLKETPAKQKLFGSKPTYILGWTTTPWTLPGNLILAVGDKIDYVVIKDFCISRKGKTEDSYNELQPAANYILAAECFDNYRENFYPLSYDNETKVVLDSKGNKYSETIKGQRLVGLKYEPLYDIYRGQGYKNLDKAWQIYPANFVDTSAGTGVVHIASGYGEDDMVLAQSLKLPIIQHVNIDGSFIEELGDTFKKHNLVGAANKSKADRFIAEELKNNGYFFTSHSYTHSYPHCWRCETPLLNYATDSYYVSIEKIKSRMLASNKKTNWIPEHLRDGRFGKWLEEARDWAISRNRYWGAPLPVWKGTKGSVECLGSFADLRARLPKRFTKFTLIRHGQSEGNTVGLRQSREPGTSLTKLGQKQIKVTAKQLKKIHHQEAFDLILHSPLLRTRQSADIISQALGKKIPVQEEKLIHEIKFGDHEGKRDLELKDYIKKRNSMPLEERYQTSDGGKNSETHQDVSKRAMQFLKKMIKEHPGKSLLVVTHSDVIRLLLRELEGKSLENLYHKGHFPMGVVKEIYIDNQTGRLVDLHKHFVDDMIYKHPKTKETMRRIPEVLDCWFESGSMPYAQSHYPFENKKQFEETFPASFIAEGLDQTRGWFYTLMVLSSALFHKPAFQNVIVNGIVLAEDGQKMSKSKQNYPDPQKIFDSYGADAMRLYLMHSPVVKADDLRFSEKGVEEVVRQTLLPLWNAYSFLLTYAEIDQWRPKGQIYFVRHGETDHNKVNLIQGAQDLPLNDHGRDQMQSLRQGTKQLPIDVIVSSDYLRAKQSADIINADFDLEIQVLSSLREQSFGKFEGQPFQKFMKQYGSQAEASYQIRRQPPQGESLAKFETRVLQAIQSLRQKYPHQNLLIVAHSGVYKVLRKNMLGISWPEYYEQFNYLQNGELQHLYETTTFQPSHKLDRWIISEINTLTKELTSGLDQYDLITGLDPLVKFIDSLTNWYIRRSRRRFWKSTNDQDKHEAYQTLYIVLVEVCKLLAPFAPFITEAMYRNLTGLESVHLADWPSWQGHRIDVQLNQEVAVTRQIVALGHAARAKANIKVRQPLAKLEVALPPGSINQKELTAQIDVICEELNIKKIKFLDSVANKVRIVVKPNGALLGPKLGKAVQDVIREAKAGNYKLLNNGHYKVLKHELTPEEIEIVYESLDKTKGAEQVQADQGMVVILDTNITSELRREGYIRDMVRTIQDLRKQADLQVSDRIKVGLTTDSSEVKTAIAQFKEFIQKETLATEISSEKRTTDLESVINLENHGVVVTLEKA